MSSYNKVNTKNISTTPKKVVKTFCKVCHDAGKTEKEYSNHFVKSLEGKVICPTLLSQSCLRCNKKGHTVSFCFLIEKEQKMLQKTERTRIYEKENKKINKKVNKNKKSKCGFDLLAYSSDDEELEEDVKEEEPVVFKEEVKKEEVFTAPSITYASIVANSYAAAVPIPVPVPAPIAKSTSVFVKKYKNWADYESSDDEE